MEHKSAHTVLWSGIEKFGAQALQVVFTVILARLLQPSDFGLMAMLTVIWFIGQILIDSGIGQSLIQKTNRTETDFNTTFYFNICIAVVLYLILFFTAPLIAGFYSEPQLVLIIRVTGLSLLFSSLNVVQGTKLTIALNFKAHAKISFLAMIIGGACGVVMALLGYGVWALVTQILVNSFVKMIMFWYFSKWRPQWLFSKQSFLSLFKPGSQFMLASVMDVIYKNMFSVVIGKKYTTTDVGYFSQAYSLANLASSNISHTIARAFYPLQCESQKQDEELLSSFYRFLRMSCYIIFPIIIALGIFAQPIVNIFLGSKWLSAVPYLQILCLSSLWQPIMVLNNHLLMIKGRFDYVLRAEIIKKAIGVALFIVMLPYGIEAVCYSLLLYAFVDMITVILYVKKLLKTSFLKQFKILIPIFIVNMVLAACLFAVQYFVTSNLWQLIIGIPVAFIIYFGITSVLKFPELSYLLDFMKSNSKKNP